MTAPGPIDDATADYFALTYQTRQYDTVGTEPRGGERSILNALANPPQAAVDAEEESFDAIREREQ